MDARRSGLAEVCNVLQIPAQVRGCLHGQLRGKVRVGQPVATREEFDGCPVVEEVAARVAGDLQAHDTDGSAGDVRR
jgi:hypothetical protein